MRLQNNIRIWIRTWPQDFAFMDNGTAPTIQKLKKNCSIKSFEVLQYTIKNVKQQLKSV